MSYETIAPVADKLLKQDGSIATFAGETLLPADAVRAKEYLNRSAAADKWLRADGSVTDMAGVVLLPPDESRALDYAGRAAIAAAGFFPDGVIGGDNIWLGTRDEYNALSAGERNDPDIVHFIKEGS